MTLRDPAAIAEELVRDAPGGKGGRPDILYLEGCRWLIDVGASEADCAAFDDRFEELTGYRAPPPAPPQKPAPRKQPSRAELTEQAITAALSAFDAPHDGSRARTEVLRQRAFGSARDLLAQGASKRALRRAIDDATREIDPNWRAPLLWRIFG